MMKVALALAAVAANPYCRHTSSVGLVIVQGCLACMHFARLLSVVIDTELN